MINDDFSPASYGGQIGPDGIWNYASSNNGMTGGHAMCVLGYDDYKAGGSFLVRNSWGRTFGADGNVWIKYRDFKKIISEAWVIVPENYIEFQTTSNAYSFDFKDIGVPGVFYGRLKAEGSEYEGLYIEGEQVWAFELYADGGVYFGQFIDFVKHGKGVYFDEDSERYVMTFRNGELIDGQRGFASMSDEQMSEYDEAFFKKLTQGELPEYDGELPNVNYSLPKQ